MGRLKVGCESHWQPHEIDILTLTLKVKNISTELGL